MSHSLRSRFLPFLDFDAAKVRFFHYIAKKSEKKKVKGPIFGLIAVNRLFL
jgi:hypothetical protein